MSINAILYRISYWSAPPRAAALLQIGRTSSEWVLQAVRGYTFARLQKNELVLPYKQQYLKTQMSTLAVLFVNYDVIYIIYISIKNPSLESATWRTNFFIFIEVKRAWTSFDFDSGDLDARLKWRWNRLKPLSASDVTRCLYRWIHYGCRTHRRPPTCPSIIQFIKFRESCWTCRA